MAIKHICDECGITDSVTQHYLFTGHLDDETGYPDEVVLDLCDVCFVGLYINARNDMVKDGAMLTTPFVKFEGEIAKRILNNMELAEANK